MNALYLSTNGDTTTYLTNPLHLKGYGCAITEIHGKVMSIFKDRMYLCCDICEESIVGNEVKESAKYFLYSVQLPVLREISRTGNGFINNTISHVVWLKVTRPLVSHIRLYITDEKGDVLSVSKNNLKCTLLLVPFDK